jgi:acyl dehydratase
MSESQLAAGDVLGTYRVRARNIASDSENKIHDDTVARRYGFAGGLVPGIAVFGYLTRPVAERWGIEWLGGGTISARFLQPCYEGEEIAVQACSSSPRSDGTPEVELSAARPDGTECAKAIATFRGTAAPPEPRHYPPAPLPAERPAASATSLASGTILGTLALRLDETRATAFADSISDDVPLYRGARGIAHPALLLALANRVLAGNVLLGPWIHVSSDVSHFSLARYGEAISLRARVAECFERKGHEFVVLDILVVAEPDRPVQHIRHTAIYKPRPHGSS